MYICRREYNFDTSNYMALKVENTDNLFDKHGSVLIYIKGKYNLRVRKS